MGKVRAEIQRNYRQRKKEQLGDVWNEKEACRKRRKYIPSLQLGPNELQKRREIIRIKVANHRQRLREKKQQEASSLNVSDFPTPSTSTSSSSINSPQVQNSLIVRIDFKKGVKCTRKRTSRALAKSYRKIGKLELQNTNLKKKINTTQRQVLRLQRSTNSRQLLSPITASTPRKKTDDEMRQAGISPRGASGIRKKLLLANTICKEIHLKHKRPEQKTKTVLRNCIAGKIIKKYRLVSLLSRSTGMKKAALLSASGSLEPTRRLRLPGVRSHVQILVSEFLQRDGNSYMLPGKKDCTKKLKNGNERIQKRILSDYLHLLYEKFIAENPDVQMSLATFCRYRPKHVITVRYASRNVCLCQRHQNLSMKLKALQLMNAVDTTSPDEFGNSCTTDPIFLESVLKRIQTTVRYDEWQKITVETGGKNFKKLKIVNNEVQSEKFKSLFELEVRRFLQHVSNVITQFRQLKCLKENLPEGHMLVQMDFAENYTCQQYDEVQSAYWNTTSVTIHPIVVYYNDTKSPGLTHASFAIISDDLNHDAVTICEITNKIVPELRKLNDVRHIHYWTDSPTSQYRNKTIFDHVSHHDALFGIHATWNYFESGHGKGPCDGIGGTVKRQADDAMKRGVARIQDAHDFYAWAVSCQTVTKVNMLFVSSKDIALRKVEIEKYSAELQTIIGTMKLHAVTGVEAGKIKSRETSCYCHLCLTDGKFSPACDGWKLFQTRRIRSTSAETTLPTQSATRSATTFEPPIESCLAPSDWVAAVYDTEWYIGEIEEEDTTDDTLLVRFMIRTKQRSENDNSWRWSANVKEDTVWIERQFVLVKIAQPIGIGRSCRNYRISDEDLVAIGAAYNQWRKFQKQAGV